MEIGFTGERIVPGATNCEPSFAQKMYQEHVARYAFAAQLVEGKDVLDLACGVGYGSQWLGKAGAKSVVGIDIAEDAIEHAKKNYFHPSVSYRVQDARWMDFDRKFDVVTCFEFIEHVDEQAKVLDAIKRALRPDGLLVISTPRPLDDKRTDFHVHELEFEELRRMLADRFGHVEYLFERNCFTSFVGSEEPRQIERLVNVTEKLKLEDADYFIFVATLAQKPPPLHTKPTLVLNDDAYVLTLEQDIVNLRNGENYHNNLITDLAQKSEGLGEELLRARSELDINRQRASDLTSIQEQLAALAGEVAFMRDEVRVSAQLAAVQGELEALRLSHQEVVQLNDRLSGENEQIRSVLAKVSQKLAETETRLNAKQAEAGIAERLTAELASAREQHAREFGVLSQRYEQSEQTLFRFRHSVSWRVTRPIRWVGRHYKKIIGGSAA